jgi:hypothetical protein
LLNQCLWSFSQKGLSHEIRAVLAFVQTAGMMKAHAPDVSVAEHAACPCIFCLPRAGAVGGENASTTKMKFVLALRI